MASDPRDPTVKHYAERKPWELEPHFSAHMSAMTGERLHDKSDIAAELAHRDGVIERLRADLARAEALNRINVCGYCHAQFQRTEDGVRQLAKHILCCERNPLAVALHRVADERDAAIAAHKNMHRALCARFGYPHDDHEWRRDQVSLEEYIARLVDLLRAECAAGRAMDDDSEIPLQKAMDRYADARVATNAAGAMGAK